ncbi:MAG TPA: hypothetical protein VIH37_03320 [Candidatus Limnocylindrales bacterium]
MDQALDRPREVRAVTYTHEYAVSMHRLAWWTLAITAVMGVLSFVMGVPPAFDTLGAKMYFHAIGLGLASLAAYLVIAVFGLEATEPPVDFPIRYRSFLSVVLAAAGGLLYLDNGVFQALPDVAVLLFTLAFLFALDVAGALLVQLFVMPRKRAGVYQKRSKTVGDYITRLVPRTPADRAAYRGMGSGYWLAVASVASVVFAMLIGFANLWVRVFGPSFFAGLMGWLGLDQKGFLDATLDPHSHMVAIALIALATAAMVARAGVLSAASPLRRALARAGAWVAIVGVIGTSVVLGAVAFLGFAPPTLFASPDGLSGMAGDDAVMAIVFLGAVLVALGILAGRDGWRDRLHLVVLGTWLASVSITVVEGFWIEFHEDQFQGAMSANDAAFSAAHPMAGLFLMIGLSLALLLVDAYGVQGRARTAVTAVGAVAVLAVLAGVTLWTFADPSTSGAPYYLYLAGVVASYAAVLAAGLAVRPVKVAAFSRDETAEAAPDVRAASPARA